MPQDVMSYSIQESRAAVDYVMNKNDIATKDGFRQYDKNLQIALLFADNLVFIAEQDMRIIYRYPTADFLDNAMEIISSSTGPDTAAIDVYNEAAYDSVKGFLPTA